MPDDRLDYYQLLEVDPRADTEQIQKAWQNQQRLLISRNNAPNLKRRNEVVLQIERINEARKVLCDDKKRRDYDQKRAKPAPRMEAPNAQQVNPYAQQVNPYAQQVNPYAQQVNPYEQQMNPIAPPMPPSQVRYHQPPAANAKRNNRIVVRGMGGGAIGGAGAFGILAAIVLAGQISAGRDVLIKEAILATAIVGTLGAIAGAIAVAIDLVIIRILAGKNALAFCGRKNAAIAAISIIEGIVAGAAIPLCVGVVRFIIVFGAAVVVSGALVAEIVDT